jgi:hypothetical protein
VVKLGENVGRRFRVLDQIEKGALILEVEISEDVGDVGGVRLDDDLGEVRKSTAADEFLDGIEEHLQFLVHGNSLLGVRGEQVKRASLTPPPSNCQRPTPAAKKNAAADSRAESFSVGFLTIFIPSHLSAPPNEVVRREIGAQNKRAPRRLVGLFYR